MAEEPKTAADTPSPEPIEGARAARASRYPVVELSVTLGAIAAVVLAIMLIQGLQDDGGASPSPSSIAFTDLNGNPATVEVGVVSGDKAAIGRPATGFNLPDPDGAIVSLASYRGRPVVINFWATWCAPCRREVPDFVALQEEWGDGARIVGVNLQEQGPTVANFAADYGINYPIALDLNGEVTRAYRLTGLPETFFVDSEGILRDHRIGVVRPATARCVVASLGRGDYDPKDCRQ